MSYNPRLLFGKILDFLDESPSITLGHLARNLSVGRRTIEGAIKFVTGGTFELLRQEILLVQIRTLLASEPTLSIKELGHALGFKSPTSFERSVKRASGFSPEELRIHVARDVSLSKPKAIKAYTSDDHSCDAGTTLSRR
jgi:transcriptional regulator GlxA family with amidase domain